MPRKPIIAGNWKMNLDRGEALELARGIARHCDQFSTDVVICPPSVYLDAVGQAIRDSAVALGAQNMHHASRGAFTGEISAGMLVDLGCSYVILGHSERRQLLGETDLQVHQKLQAALEAGLTPIVCVGETLQERERGETVAVVRSQLEGSLGQLSNEQLQRTVIAYEPVWAIGTGRVATPAQAEAVQGDLRKLLETSYNAEVAADVRIQYGGSVKPDNARDLLSQPDIDGALVGGASLEVDSFLGIVRASDGN